MKLNFKKKVNSFFKKLNKNFKSHKKNLVNIMRKLELKLIKE